MFQKNRFLNFTKSRVRFFNSLIVYLREFPSSFIKEGNSFEVIYVLLNELKQDEFITLNQMYTSNNKWEQGVEITPQGTAFIKAGGYSSSFFGGLITTLINQIKKNIAAAIGGIILALIIGLTIAYLTHRFGWN